MLSVLRSAVVALGLLGLASPAHAEPPSAKPARSEPSRSLREPVRLTAGTGSELMGVPAPDARSLYFVSDAEGTLDIMRQSPIQSSPVPLSQGFGDAAWPQIAPDGRHIAYISFERDSTGDACVRGIADLEGEEEQCWPSPASAEQVVLWWDAGSLAVLSRQGLHGDFRLVRQPLDERPPTVLLERNMVGLALSPDRRWLAYIPLDKTTREVGITFSQKTAVGIALQRFEPAPAPADGSKPPQGRPPGAVAEPVLYVPPLPGVTGSVTFSTSGEHLLFTQFLNDSNRDGAIDGDDNAVVFRVAFDAAAREPIALGNEPDQLTSGRWDCHYPAPSSRALIVSCSHMGSLDVYALPLDGAVPESWDDARLAGEVTVARDLWTKLLFWARRLALAPNEETKQAIVREMIALHLELGEYESTIYYAERRLGAEQTQRWGHVVAELARHRSADLALVRGQTSSAYVDRERARAGQLRSALPGAPAEVAALIRLVVSEIEDDIGEKSAALATFREIPVAALEAPLLAPLVARRAERLYRLRGDRQSLLGVYRVLAGLRVLGVSGRLEYAQRYLRELARGQTRAAYADAIQIALSQSAEASELALLLDAENILLALGEPTTRAPGETAAETPEEKARDEAVRERLYKLYTQNDDRERRRALVLAILRAAAKAGSEMLQYQFVTSWASSLRREDPERKNAEALYELVVLDRGYGEVRQGALGEGRGYFYAATLATDSLEAHIGFIEARLAEGGPGAARELDEIYAKRFAKDPDSPVYAFVRAYRVARELWKRSDLDEHERDVDRVVDWLLQVDEQLPKQPQVHQLWGLALHQRSRRTGSAEAAADANRQYELALALAQGDERLTATLLFRLGLLQASLGNHGVALRYLQKRDELPHIRPLEGLGLRLAIAESARHMGDGPLARQQMLAAAKLLETEPELAAFEPLVLDRLALSLTVAKDSKAARDSYESLERVLERTRHGLPLNRVKAKVGLAANALESDDPRRALRALDEAERLLEETDELEPEPDIVWSKRLVDDYHYTSLQYHALVAGLRARAEQTLGDDTKALAAMSQRVRLLDERLDESGIDEDRLELAQAHRELAKLQVRTKDPGSAARSLERGLELSDEFDRNTGSQVNDTGLGLLRDYAELHLYGDVPLDALRRDLPAELRESYRTLCKFRNPRWNEPRYLFKTYLAEIQIEHGDASAEANRGAR
jgi:cellulose synthase operon protein C